MQVLNVLTKIMATCLLFADHVNRFSESFDQLEIPKATPSQKVPRKSSGRLSGGGSQASDLDLEAIAQRKAQLATVDRNRRRMKQQLQTEYIIRESKQEAFSRYLALFEGKFDKEVTKNNYIFSDPFILSFNNVIGKRVLGKAMG